MNRFNTRTARAALALALTGILSVPEVAEAQPIAPVTPATFRGRTIDLTKGWGGARACIERSSGTVTCYASEDELQTALAAERTATTRRAARRGTTATATAAATAYDDEDACPSYVRVYSGQFYSGTVLYFETRWTFRKLSYYGMGNAVSSYRVGACAAGFWDSANGYVKYPGNSSAWSTANYLLTGWDNRIDLLYIY